MRSAEHMPGSSGVFNPATNAVGRYAGRLDRLVRQLRAVNLELSAWDEHECDHLLPADLRRNVPPPGVSRETLRELRATIVGAIDDWETYWLRRN
jgi:hypothetical protein